MGTDFTWESQDEELDKLVAPAAREHSEQLLQNAFAKVELLDEITYKYVDLDEVVAVLVARPKDQHIVTTGRARYRASIEMANIASEVSQ